MKAKTKVYIVLKKVSFCFLASLFFCSLSSMQNLHENFTNLDQINSSFEKPRLSFVAFEKSIANLEKMALQLNQEIISLKQQLNDLKDSLKQGAKLEQDEKTIEQDSVKSVVQANLPMPKVDNVLKADDVTPMTATQQSEVKQNIG